MEHIGNQSTKATMIKNRFYHLLLILFCCYSTITFAAEEEMPIIAYWGVPDTMSYERCFQDFSECGFTVSIYPYHSQELLVKACRIAEKYGVKIIGTCPEIHDVPEHAAQSLRQEKGFLGYMIQDEPSLPEISERQKEIERINATDSLHLFYINLLPYYRKDWFLNSAQVDNYQAYVKAASATSCQQISFDYYPITTEGMRGFWYYNLELVHKESQSANKPFWGFALSVPHSVYPQPTIGSLRLQVYSNLAYGAQGIQYFTYWTPEPTDDFDYHDAPIGLDGKKTKTYKLVQQMNRELKTVAKLFYGAKILSVHHLGAIPEGTSQLNATPPNLLLLKIKGHKGAVISQFEKDGHHYMAIVNKSYEEKLNVQILSKNNVPRHITKDLQEKKMKNSYSIEAGDLLLFKLK